MEQLWKDGYMNNNLQLAGEAVLTFCGCEGRRRIDKTNVKGRTTDRNSAHAWASFLIKELMMKKNLQSDF